MNVHGRTPELSVDDPRGLPVRTVDYWRTEAVEPAQTRVNRTLMTRRARCCPVGSTFMVAAYERSADAGESDLGVFTDRPSVAFGQRRCRHADRLARCGCAVLFDWEAVALVAKCNTI